MTAPKLEPIYTNLKHTLSISRHCAIEPAVWELFHNLIHLSFRRFFASAEGSGEVDKANVVNAPQEYIGISAEHKVPISTAGDRNHRKTA